MGSSNRAGAQGTRSMWTPEKLARLRDLAAQGLMSSEIAEAMDTTVWSVRNAAYRYQIPIRGLQAGYQRKVAGNRFYEARKALAMTIAEAAEALETTEQTVRSWEHGRRLPRSHYLKAKIREVYGIEV